MSQENRGEEEPDEELSESSVSSGSTSCITATTNTTSSSRCSDSESKGTSSSGSDNEGDNDDLQSHRHRQCQKSRGQLSGTSGRHDRGDSHHVDQTTERLQPTTGQKSDTQTTSTNSSRERECDCKSKQETTSHQSSNTPSPHSAVQQQSAPSEEEPVQSPSKANLDKSASERLLGDDARLSKHGQHHYGRNSLSTNATPLGSSYSNLSSRTSILENALATAESQSRRTLRPAPSPSPSLSTIDTNNNKGYSFKEGLSNIKRTNFSKSASGSRLINRSRPNVCDCLTQDCGEKKHSSRRQFIEHYYNSRTQLPTANTSTSTFNISTPLNRLSECDAITRRLLSSPIRATNIVESPVERAQVSEIDKSRRASLGTNTITNQVFLYASGAFDSSLKKNRDNGIGSQIKCEASSTNTGKVDTKLKQQQQPQQQTNITGRSLSVCDEETLNPRIRGTNANHSSNLNRAISLAYDSGSSTAARRLLTIIPLFGCDIKSLEQFTRLGLVLPPVIDSAVDYLLINGIDAIGIFRKSGVKSRILSLKQQIEANQNLKFAELNQNNEFSIYDIADLVKMWFRDLKPVPLMTKELIKIISSFLNRSSNNTLPGILAQQDSSVSTSRTTRTLSNADTILKSKINSITTLTHRAVLLRALSFLSKISSRCETNQMTSQNLAICLTPSLCEMEPDQNSILHDQRALEYCIDNHLLMFDK